MKKLTPEEAKELIKKPVVDDCFDLGCGESLHVERTDWEYKSNPNTILLNYKQSKGMTFKVIGLAKKKGWVIKRIS
jgi:hypothetical protein